MSSLTDRYVAATLRTVPAQRRDEISTELRAAIADMIEGRTDGGQDPATAEREVLTELGAPDQLAARYTDRILHLIGPTYYLLWWNLLRRLLTYIPATVGVVVGVVAAATDRPGGPVGPAIAAAVQTAVQIAFWTTLVFAVLERTRTPLDLPAWTPDRLPEAPVERDTRLPETCATIAMVLFLAGFLIWQHFHSWVAGVDGRDIPLLDPALWHGWLPALLAVLLLSVLFEVVKYRIGRWTWPLFGLKTVLDLAFCLPLLWLLWTDRLLNPALIRRFEWLRDEGNLDTLVTITIASIVLVTLWGLVETAVKTYRATR
ncbi:permease prefix domain 1-containing protein [Micromonospora sp. WMMD975]|uniref:permease prefix domain 1-containing protein n=1 Tax=Micromonospora sp. WMMD975 TaxID=3016087 RepID=UPI00249A107D|nr:permease prefix domain 1-containing protein [Micromonospora sp. WMMD975]WFE34946.1 permease prefix domain 1-containing protein [Micromonospora sp. WMMD975]